MKTITCSAARRLLNLAVDQRLSPKSYATLERHLALCDACRQERAYLETLRAALTDAKCAETPAPEPAELTQLIMARIADYEAAKGTNAAKAIKADAPQRRVKALNQRAPARLLARSPWLIWLIGAHRIRQSVVVNAWKTWRAWEMDRPSWRLSALALMLLAFASGLWVFAWPAPLPFSAGRLTPAHVLMDGALLFAGLAQWLLAPGPESIAWIVWVSGALVALSLVVWMMRSEGSAAWRRTLADRLPQLW